MDTSKPSKPEEPQDENEPELDDDMSELLSAFAAASESDDPKAQEEAALKAFEKIMEMDHEPSPWLIAMGKAHEREAVADWEGAEKAYKAAIATEPDKPSSQAMVWEKLSSLYSMTGRDDMAFEAAQIATSLERSAPHPMLLHIRLAHEAAFYLKWGDWQKALELVEEALAWADEEIKNSIYQAQLLPTRARCLILKGDLDAARADLHALWKLVDPHDEGYFFAGWQGAFANYWQATAQLCVSQGDLEGVAKAHREVVYRRRIIAELPQLEGPYKHNSLARALHDLAQALQNVGDPEADELFEESRSLRRSIGLDEISV